MTDPRVRRTRALLQNAFLDLVKVKRFEDISVQDLTEAATVNRATFYAHYPDKHALLECVASLQFAELLDRRGVRFDGTCFSAIRVIALGVCDYLAVESSRLGSVDALDPHVQAAIVSVVRRMLHDGLKRIHNWQLTISREMAATSAAWALYGAIREWFVQPERRPAEEVADQIYSYLLPLLNPSSELI
jgi:AcrR family transcriptional regulator